MASACVSSSSSPPREPAAARGLPRDDGACQRILRAEDHYAVLGVARGAEEAEVQREFRRSARSVHPDKNASPLASEAFKRLSRAHEVLTSPSLRRRFDATGSEEPELERRRAAPRHQHYAYGCSNDEEPHSALLGGFFPVFLAMLLSILYMLVQGSSAQGAPRQSQPKKAVEEFPLRLWPANAEAACGAAARQLCVVLLTRPGRGVEEKERLLLVNLRRQAAESVRTPRGQSLLVTWAHAEAVGRWASLLPQGAALPWMVVLKPARNGLRVARLPVPKEGANAKRRLSEGVPELLQNIASGGAKFEPLGLTVSELFHR